MSYVVYIHDLGRMDTAYWTGGMVNGEPSATENVGDAIRFDTAREAYEIAGMHDTMQYWRVRKEPVG